LQVLKLAGPLDVIARRKFYFLIDLLARCVDIPIDIAAGDIDEDEAN